jgi:hypothetical protein
MNPACTALKEICLLLKTWNLAGGQVVRDDLLPAGAGVHRGGGLKKAYIHTLTSL